MATERGTCPNTYNVRLSARGEVLLTFSNGETPTLSQENAANLAAHIATTLEGDAWIQFRAHMKLLLEDDFLLKGEDP